MRQCSASARNRGSNRDGGSDLEGPFLLDRPLALERLREREVAILNAQDVLAQEHRRIYAPFYGYGSARQLRPAQHYLNKLARSVFSLLPELAASGAAVDAVADVRPAVADGVALPEIGVAWREPHVAPGVGDRRSIEIDTEAVERGLRGHVDTELALSAALRQLGIEPMSPSSPAINYDVLWELGDALWVAEVKSTTPRNEEGQLRRGLGQIVRYRRKLVDTYGRPVRALLVPERTPADAG